MGRWSFKNFSSQNHLWQREERGWESHTVPMKRARMLVNGYLTLVKKLKLDVGGANRCSVLDIGAGAGYIGATFLEHGYSVLSTEHTQDGIDLINKHNPNLKTELFDISNHESNIDKKFDIIICRELYPFTRVNCFESQLEALNNILNFLDNNGVLLLIGSNIKHPHCADYKLLFNTLNSDKEYKYCGSYAEPFVSRKYILNTGVIFMKIISFCLSALFLLVNSISDRQYADIKVYIIKKPEFVS